MADAARSQEGSSLAGVRIALLGRLAGMSQRETQRLIRERGGIVLDKPDATANLLVTSDEVMPAEIKRDARGRAAESIDDHLRSAIEQGLVQVIGETELWRRLGLVDFERDIQRLYTPAMLANLLRVDIAVIRRWQRRGVLRPVRCVRRLAYFDFAQVVAARQLAELLNTGASPAAIERQWLEWNRVGSGHAPAGFAVVGDGRRLVRRHGDELIEVTGQRWFSFVVGPQVPHNAPSSPGVTCAESIVAFPQTAGPKESAAPSPETLTEMAQDLETQGELAAALDVYRAALAAGGPNADLCFAVAELLYRLGDPTAARERYFMAIELDECFVEARANLGCLLAEQGQSALALAAFEGALQHHPEYADAHYHLAKTLHRLDRRDEAISHWKAFLRLAPSSPWAAEVRLLLALAGEENVEPS